MTQFSEEIIRTCPGAVLVTRKFGQCLPTIRRQNEDFWCGYQVHLFYDNGNDPAVKEAERLAMRKYTKERGYECSFMRALQVRRMRDISWE